jgi:hypothetical protein
VPQFKIVLTLSAVAIGLGSSACSSGAAPPSATTRVATVTVSATASATPSESTPNREDVAWQNFVAFTESVMDDDFKKARTFVAPDSTAARYLDYHEGFRKAHSVNGVELPEAPSTVAEPDQDAHTISLVDGSKTSSVWKDYQSDATGKITTWVGRKPLGETIATKVTHGKGLGQTLTLLGASAQKDGNLYVVIEVNAKRDASVDSAPSYVGRDGLRRTASGWVAPSEVEAGTKAIALYIFDDTGLGGTMTYEAWAGDARAKIRIKVG